MVEIQKEEQKRNRNPFGFCMLDGEPCYNPEKVGVVFVCLQCKRTRLEDCLTLNGHIKQWFQIE